MLTDELLQKADKDYRTFPSFQEWLQSRIDLEKWERNTARLKETISNSPELLK
jgi:hypothetical protein